MRVSTIVCASFLVVCLLWTGASADDEIHVLSPASLKAQFPAEGLAHRPAMFGVPSYAVAITGPIVYATPGDRDGCDPHNDTSSWPVGERIIMVDRGDCTFVDKVRAIQNAGGSAAIVADNTDEAFLPFMADDGTGQDIYIPSMLISKADAQTIKDAMIDSTVSVEMTWSLPAPDGRVEWSLWTSANDPQTRTFKQSFNVAVDALALAAQFTPNYFVLNGASSGCTLSSRPCRSQCTDDGKYCAVDPDHDLDDNISGLDIVEENLRQICIWQSVNNTGTEEDRLKWWSYASAFISDCCTPQDFASGVCTKDNFDAECSARVQEDVGIDTTAVATCVSNSWATDGTNSLLDAMITLRYSNGIYFLPTATVNNSPYRGSLLCPGDLTASCGLLGAICAGYVDGQQPQACTGDATCPLGEVRDQCGACGGSGSVDKCGVCLAADSTHRDQSCLADGVTTAEVVLLIIFGAALVGTAVFFYVRHQRRATLQNIDDILRAYLPLEEASEVSARATGKPHALLNEDLDSMDDHLGVDGYDNEV